MILLLTGCINPQGMSYTSISNQEERRRQYEKAIHFYLDNTSYDIVFVENSGTDISDSFQKEKDSEKIEFLSFNGNTNKTRGKGYGECEIIQYALNNSRLLKLSKDKVIVKITGRLIIKNIKSLIKLHRCIFNKRTTICSINSELTFPDSRIIIASEDFYRELVNRKELINDSEGVFFEHVLCKVLREAIQFPYSPFLIIPQIEGVSGSTGEKYVSRSTNISFIFRYVRYSFSLKRKFHILFRNKIS